MSRGLARDPRIQPVGARSCATGVARLTKMNTGPCGHRRSQITEPAKEGLGMCDAGRAGARPYRRSKRVAWKAPENAVEL
jgi:hypothetical protein